MKGERTGGGRGESGGGCERWEIWDWKEREQNEEMGGVERGNVWRRKKEKLRGIVDEEQNEKMGGVERGKVWGKEVCIMMEDARQTVKYNEGKVKGRKGLNTKKGFTNKGYGCREDRAVETKDREKALLQNDVYTYMKNATKLMTVVIYRSTCQTRPV